MLPKSCILPESLLDIRPPPASGDALDDPRLQVEYIRIQPNDALQKVKEARFRSHFFRIFGIKQPIDLLPSGRGVETFRPSKNRPPSGCNHRSPPIRFESDARREPYGICHEPPWCGQTESRACPFCCIPVWHLRSCQLADVAEGLNYLHSYDVIHGDLKGVRGGFRSLPVATLTSVSRTFSWTQPATHGSQTSVSL